MSPAGRAEADIRNTVTRLAHQPGGWVKLSALRPQLAARGYSRQEQDAALAVMARGDYPGVHIIAEENQNTLTQADREAALRFGGEDNHLIRTEGGDPGPQPGRPTVRQPLAQPVNAHSLTRGDSIIVDGQPQRLTHHVNRVGDQVWVRTTDAGGVEREHMWPLNRKVDRVVGGRVGKAVTPDGKGGPRRLKLRWTHGAGKARPDNHGQLDSRTMVLNKRHE